MAAARRGFIAVTWDMIGLGDDRYGDDFYVENPILQHTSPYNTVIQTYNSIRLLDYLLSENARYKVNENYVAMTGVSGGATQTMYHAMFDSTRLTASIPVAMISAYFPGTCKCENGINALRTRNLRSNNVERIATFAPNPLLIISVGTDWTRRTPDVEVPLLSHIYSFFNTNDFNAESNFENAHFQVGRHDYDHEKRVAALDFLVRQWGLSGIYTKPYCIEEDYGVLLSPEELRTFTTTSGLSRPDNFVTSNRQLFDLIRIND